VLIDGGLDGQTIRFEGNIGSRGGGGIIVSHADLSESVSASNNFAPVGSPASKLSSQGADLPFSPASWRGGHGRRSISQD